MTAIDLTPTERAVLAEVLPQVFPRETDVDAFLARRLDCGTPPALVVMLVRTVRAAVRVVGQPAPPDGYATWADVLDTYDDELISWRELDHAAEPRYKALRAAVEGALAGQVTGGQP